MILMAIIPVMCKDQIRIDDLFQFLHDEFFAHLYLAIQFKPVVFFLDAERPELAVAAAWSGKVRPRARATTASTAT